jgi:hypothetical protein
MAACIALLRCIEQAPILPLSSESCAAAISFCYAFAISHVLDHGFGLAQVVAAIVGAHFRGVGGNGGIGEGSDSGCHDQSIEHGTFPSSVF